MNTISVIIPAYNHEAYIAEAIQSVLAQTSSADEIIVVDDGSTDRTADIARAYPQPVRCIRQENQGLGGSRNAGLRHARGSLIAFLDSDDFWLDRKLELQSAYLSAHPDVDMVFCHMRNFLSPEIDRTTAFKFNESELPACNTSSLLARREVFQKAGLFPIERDSQEFFVWFKRACDLGLRYYILPELLLLRRVHLTNTVHNPTYRLRYFRFLKQHLDSNRSSN